MNRDQGIGGRGQGSGIRGYRLLQAGNARRLRSAGEAPALRPPLHPPRNRAAFSLLEVILAVAILTGAIAVLGELGRIGFRNADRAEKLTRAQLLAESKMAEITSGMTLAEPVQGAAFELEWVEAGDQTAFDSPYSGWLYTIDAILTDEQGLMELWVTVYEDLPPQKQPVTFTLVQWWLDPSYQTSEEEPSE